MANDTTRYIVCISSQDVLRFLRLTKSFLNPVILATSVQEDHYYYFTSLSKEELMLLKLSFEPIYIEQDLNPEANYLTLCKSIYD